MSRHASFCSTCHAQLPDDAEHCQQHRSGVYMMETYGSARVVDIGPPRTATEVLADPPRLFASQEPLPRNDRSASPCGLGSDSCDSDVEYIRQRDVRLRPADFDQERILFPKGERLLAQRHALLEALTAAEADNAELHIRLAAAQQRLLELDSRASTPPPAGDGE